MTAMGLKKPSTGFIQPQDGDLTALNNAQIEVRPRRRCRPRSVSAFHIPPTSQFARICTFIWRKRGQV